MFQTKDNPPQSSRLIESVCPCGCLFVLFSWPALVKFRKVRLSYTLRMQSLETNVTRKAFPLNPRTSIVRGFDKKQILHEKYTFFLCMSKILKHTLNILSASNLNAFVSIVQSYIVESNGVVVNLLHSTKKNRLFCYYK